MIIRKYNNNNKNVLIMRTLKILPTMKHLLLLVVMLFCSMSSVLADDSSLITQQITINVAKAGTLKDKINSNRKYMITNLKLTGKLNNDDFEFIREMAGCYKEDGSKYDGHLQYLDLGKVKLISNYKMFNAYGNLEDDHYGTYRYSQDERPTPYSVSVSSTTISGVFAYLYDLKSIVIPEGVTYIGERTFQCCHSLSSLTLPSTLDSIGCDAFKTMGARSFSLYVKSANPPHLGNVRWHYGYKTGKKVWQEDRPFFLTGGGINTLYIPKGTLKLYKEAETWKEDFKRVKSVVEFDPIPSEELITEQRTVNVENPGSLSSLLNDYDKYRITNLKLKGELDIQDVEFIREMAGCYAEGGVPKYNGHLWYLDMSEVKFKYPKEYAYSYLTIYDKDGGKDKAYIRGEEFSCNRTKKLLAYLYNLQSVVLPVDSSKDNIYFLYNCSGLTSVKLPSEATHIAEGAFWGCSGLTSIDIPSGVTSIGEDAFCFCSGLTSIVIPSGVTSIGKYAFWGCSGLTSIVIPSGVTSIANGTFSGCSGLTSIDIPSCVTSIGVRAFYGCSKLTSVVIPSGVTSIESETFAQCSGLTSIDIPSCVTSIGRDAFWWCTGLTSIDLPSGVTSIGNRAFMNCSKLTSVVIPSGVTSIESETFRQCHGLTSIVIPSGVTSIGNEVFVLCDALTSIIIPSSVTSIGKGTFNGCYNLTSLYSYRPDPVAVDSNVFSGIDANKCTLYVPQGSFGNYYVTSGWDYFSKIVEFAPTGIDAVTTKSDAKEVSRYSVDGQKLDTPVKGLNIVKYNDGSIKKVVVE